MKYLTSELTGALLDAAVAKANGWEKQSCDGADWWWACSVEWRNNSGNAQTKVEWFKPSSDWGDGGPIIDRKRPAFRPGFEDIVADIMTERGTFVGFGPTYLIAFCRAYVESELGEEVELEANPQSAG